MLYIERSDLQRISLWYKSPEQMFGLSLYFTHFSVKGYQLSMKGSQLGMNQASLLFILWVVDIVRKGSLLASRKYNFPWYASSHCVVTF